VVVLPFSGFHIFSVGGSNIELIQPVLAVTITAWVVKTSITEHRRFKMHPIYIYPAIFLLWGFVTSIWSASLSEGLWGVAKAAWVIFLIPFSVNLIKGHNDLREVLWTWGLISAVAAAFAFGIDTESGDLQTARSSGMAMHPNALAMYLNFSIFLLIGTFRLARSSTKKILIVLICAFSFGALLSTGSRGAFLGLLCGLVVMSLGQWRLRLYKPIFLLLIVGVLGFVTFRFFSSGDLYREVTKRVQESPAITKVDTFVLRTIVWSRCVVLLKDSHYMGIGINSYEDSRQKMGKFSLQGHPHNFYLHMALEVGLIGLGIFIAFLIHIAIFTRKSLKKIVDKRHQGLVWAMLGGLGAFFIHAVVDFTFTDPEFWFYIGITIADIEVFLKNETPPSMQNHDDTPFQTGET
jgi:O-antigen ligase